MDSVNFIEEFMYRDVMFQNWLKNNRLESGIPDEHRLYLLWCSANNYSGEIFYKNKLEKQISHIIKKYHNYPQKNRPHNIYKQLDKTIGIRKL
jgi:hypothetical protein